MEDEPRRVRVAVWKEDAIGSESGGGDGGSDDDDDFVVDNGDGGICESGDVRTRGCACGERARKNRTSRMSESEGGVKEEGDMWMVMIMGWCMASVQMDDMCQDKERKI